MSRKKHQLKSRGYYSANYCIVFAFLLFMAIAPFLGEQLFIPLYLISNHTASKLYRTLAEPIVRFGKETQTAAFTQKARKLFLYYTGLGSKHEWDRFFYTELLDTEDDEALPSAHTYTANPADQNQTHKGAPDLNNVPIEGKKAKRAYHTEQLFIPYSATHPLRVLFFGDSQVYTLAAGMHRALQDDTRITIEQISVHSSGFLRSDYYNWPKKLEQVFKSKSDDQAFHAAVMLLGMNDHQSVRDKKNIYTVETEDWEALYTEKVKQHIDLVLTYVPRIYWLSVPSVRNQKYNEGLRYLDALYDRIAQTYDPELVVRVALHDFTAEYGTEYIETIKVNNTWEPFMQNDGIHYTLAGSEYLMRKFLAAYLQEDYLFD
ncbi:MAG: DUF459 domain-containing protein [Treponema sp.]